MSFWMMSSWRSRTQPSPRHRAWWWVRRARPCKASQLWIKRATVRVSLVRIDKSIAEARNRQAEDEVSSTSRNLIIMSRWAGLVLAVNPATSPALLWVSRPEIAGGDWSVTSRSPRKRQWCIGRYQSPNLQRSKRSWTRTRSSTRRPRNSGRNSESERWSKIGRRESCRQNLGRLTMTRYIQSNSTVKHNNLST